VDRAAAVKECPRCLLCFGDDPVDCPDDRVPLEAVFEGEPVLGGRYRLEQRIGRGGMGTVYRALHIALGRRFAVKVIRCPYSPAAGGRSFAARFEVEARALGRLVHPHIVQVTDYGIDARGIPYLVMEYLEGRSLSDVAQDGASFDTRLALLAQVAQAVDYGHAQGVLHRDLKPGNVLVSAGQAKILDFGLARITDDAADTHAEATARTSREAGATDAADFPGTPAYMAPELRSGAVASPASDIYAFAVLARETLDTAPAETMDCLERALAPDPKRRPASATALVAELQRAIQRARRRAFRAREWPRRLLVAALLSAVAALLGHGLAALAPVQALERKTVDVRFAAEPRQAPDPRLLLVTVDEASLALDPTPLADRADEFAAGIKALFAAGARGVAVDFLLPERWSRSAAFSRLVLTRQDVLTLGAYVAPDGALVGTECVSGLTAAALGADGMRRLFGLVNVDEDPDGVTRRLRLAFRDRDGRGYGSWPLSAVRSLGAAPPGEPGARFLNAAVDAAAIPRVSWKDVPVTLARDPGLVEGRLVLVGGDYAAAGDDHHRVAGSGEPISGLVLHALGAATVLEAHPLRDPGRTALVAATAVLALLLLVPTLLFAGPSRIAITMLAAVLLHVLAAAALFRWARVVHPVAAPVLAALLAVAGGLLIRLRLPRVE
jgi:CHASE2 domain-containing sensor protein